VVFDITASPLLEEIGSFWRDLPRVIGFENHGGRTYLADVAALGKVVKGYGNNGEDQTEGAFYQNAIATYAHGPLLPKNPFLADWLIYKSLSRQSSTKVSLDLLDDILAYKARESLLMRYGL